MTTLALLLGHLWGDYAFQTDWMAKGKIRNDFVGWSTCLAHCIVYATTMTIVFMYLLGIERTEIIYLWLIAFLAHYPIDKFSLGKIWLKNILGKNTPETLPQGTPLQAGVVYTIFYWFVYIVVDNTMHLALMTAGILWLIPRLL